MRLLQSLATFAFVAAIIFGLSRITGDPISLMLPLEAGPAEREALRRSLGLDRSIAVQFVGFLSDLSRLELGHSFHFNRPVLDLIVARLPNSFKLATTAMCLAVIGGIPVGVAAARRPGGIADRLARGFAVAGQSVPTFVVGILLILVFAVRVRWFPVGNVGGWRHYVLPAITLGWFSTAALVRISRSSMREALSSQYVTVARSKGLPERLIITRHALRNALTAILSLTALQYILIVNGAVITETIFNWPGIGLLMVEAAFTRDYALIQGLVIFAALITIVVNLATDLLYARIDSRIVLTEGTS